MSKISDLIYDGEQTDQGVLVPKLRRIFKGTYYDLVNGKDMRSYDNLIPDEGMISLLNVYYGTATKITTWYQALYAGAIDPALSWTAANFAALSSEIVSSTDGYAELTRPLWTPGAATAATTIDNVAIKATYTIVTSGGQLTVNGGALLSVSTRGGTTGILGSATRYPTPRPLSNGDNYQVGYQVSATSV